MVMHCCINHNVEQMAELSKLCFKYLNMNKIIYNDNGCRLTTQYIHITFWNQLITILAYLADLSRNIFCHNFGLYILSSLLLTNLLQHI